MKLLLLLLLVSCAQQRILVKKEFSTPYKDFAQKSVIKSSKNFSILRVTDSRKDKSALGVGLTGVNYTATPYLLSESLESYLEGYLKDSFESRNLVVVDSSADVQLEFVINELWVSELIEKHQPERAKCKVNMTVYSKLDNTTWSGNYWTEIISPGDMGDGTEKLDPTFASCLNMVFEKFITDKSFSSLVK